MPRHRLPRSRSRSASPPRRSAGARSPPRDRSRSRWSQQQNRGRSRSNPRRDVDGGATSYDAKRQAALARGSQRRRSRSVSPPPTHGGGNQEKKAKDFTHLVQWGKQEEEEEQDPDKPSEPVEKPNFGLSGALAKDRTTGNVQNGVVMKWSEPPEARAPQKRYRLYVFKGDELISTLHVHRKSAFLVGRDKAVADILTEHQSCSKQHAVLQYRLFQKPSRDGLSFENEVRPYIMDLDSTNGTVLNGEKIEGSRYIELRVKDVLKFGESTREYVLMDASSSESK
ncbi:Transcriptional regulator snip1, contains fha domain [Globisporangium polare]